jgi:DNA invertase Pin-like site-specific DNA recombinase
MGNRKIGYLRVSTAEQKPDRQVDGLEHICDELHVERLSAVSKRRPVYEAVMASLQPGDVFVIWDLDRAFRSTKDALVELDRLHARGVEILIANLSIDTGTPVGMLLYTFISALAEFERRLLSQRTREGLAAARRRGAVLGRPRKVSCCQAADADRRLREGAADIITIAAELRVHPWTLCRALRRLSEENPDPH